MLVETSSRSVATLPVTNLKRRAASSNAFVCARAATKQPLAGRRVPEVDREDLREVFVDNYRIVYTIHQAEIRVLTIFEGHRLLPPSL